MFFGTSQQDKFIIHVLNNKKNGYFLEIGSGEAIFNNNTYLLETNFNWKGIMVDNNHYFIMSYRLFRTNSIHIMDDARKIDYLKIFEENNFPRAIDYLHIALDARTGSTIETLHKLDHEVFDMYKFAIVTFQHTACYPGCANTRIESRTILKKRGYICVFEDINNEFNFPYEDWYVNPDLVNMNYINHLIENNKTKFIEHPITEKTIYWRDIQYIEHVVEPASEPAQEQASEQASEPAQEQASEPAQEQASEPAQEQASEQASEPAQEQASEPAQ